MYSNLDAESEVIKMNHSFNVKVATKYGVNPAIFIENLVFWIQKNKANNKHFYDGHYWTYNTQKAFTEIFPYWTRQNIRTILNGLLKTGILLSGNYNRVKIDQTKWYTLSKDFINAYYPEVSIHNIGENQPIALVEINHSTLVETNQPIPYINTYINTDIKTTTENDECIVSIPENKKDVVVNDLLEIKSSKILEEVDEEISKLKSEIDKKIRDNINIRVLIKLIEENGIDRVKFYLENFENIAVSAIDRSAGFFVSMIRDRYQVNTKRKRTGGIATAPQIGNFEQREYDDNFYKSLYDNL